MGIDVQKTKEKIVRATLNCDHGKCKASRVLYLPKNMMRELAFLEFRAVGWDATVEMNPWGIKFINIYCPKHKDKH